MRSRSRWSLVLLAAFVIQSAATAGPESQDLLWLLERRVRIQSPALGPGWHEGLFNRQRREPPCYVVIIWKPRSSPESSLQAENVILLGAVSELQAYSGPRTALSAWAGRKSGEASDDSLWQLIPRAVLDRNRDCSASPSSAAADGWPGLPPDCWTEPRMVHSVQDLGDLWQRNTRITTRRAGKPAAAQVSPNQGYAFAVEGSRPTARITIYAEKDHVVDIDFVELHGLSDVRWLNEKLVFLRAWWGRIAATDLIFDVEREKIIYAEALTDGSLARQQYLESCPIHGCTCVKKR